MRKIVNICFRTLFPTRGGLIEQLKESNSMRFEYSPVVFYNEYSENDTPQVGPTKWSKSGSQFSIFDNDTSFSILKNFFKTDFHKEGLLVAEKAYGNLKDLCKPLADKVIADLCCQVILQSIKDNKKNELIFFIDRMFSDKILGRLGYLYLNMEKITICFLSWRPADLVTIVMTRQTGKLHFDINRLMSEYTTERRLGPYPPSPEDALKQTYFYNPVKVGQQRGDSRILPLRFDIFSQGLRESELEMKSEEIIKILDSNTDSVIHFYNKDYPIRLPVGFSYLNNINNDMIKNMAKSQNNK